MQVDSWKVIEWSERHGTAVKLGIAALVLALIAGVFQLVYATGGIKYVYSHSMYVPIMLAAIAFGVRGGIAAGILGGLALGPYMPIDTLTGEMQATLNWLYRLAFFVLIGSIVGIASDTMRAYIRHLDWVASHDHVSGLLNRFALEEDLEELALKPRDAYGNHYLAMFTIHNAKEIEITLGSEAIHRICHQLAERIGNYFKGRVPVYRINASQLGILCTDTDPAIFATQGEALRQISERPFRVAEIDLHSDVYMGAVAFARAEKPPPFYIAKADSAVTVASGENIRTPVIVAPDDDTAAKKNLELLGRLKTAIEERQLEIHYQPKVRLESGAIHGVEALMRWHHPELGDIPPGRFIPRAETSTLIDALTDFALDESLGRHQEWKQAGIERIRTAVNVSTQNLASPGFADRVLALLDEHGADGDLLELEVTESSFMANIKRAASVLAELSEIRIVVSIDDFGTGYSSLQYMEKLPVSVIKIDQSFIRSLPANPDTTAIVEAAVSLAHKLGMEVVAEGVETAEAYAFLRDLGCDLAQGFFISRALPSEEFARWYLARQGRFGQAAANETGAPFDASV